MFGPAFGDQVDRLVAERIDARPLGQGVGDVHVQALDPVRHAAGADPGAQRFERVTLREVGLVRPAVALRKVRVLGEPIGHFPHQALGFEGGRVRHQLRRGQVVQRRKRRAVFQPRFGLHHGGITGRVARRDRVQPARRPTELPPDALPIRIADHRHARVHRQDPFPITEFQRFSYHGTPSSADAVGGGGAAGAGTSTM